MNQIIINTNRQIIPTSEREWFPWVKDAYLLELGIPNKTMDLLFSIYVNLDLPANVQSWEDITNAVLFTYTGHSDWRTLPDEDTEEFAYLKGEVRDRMELSRYHEIDE